MTQPYDERPVAPASAEDGPVQESPVHEASGEATPAEADTDGVPTGGTPAADDDGYGDPRVDDAVARLQEAAERPVGEHAEIFDDIHQRLRDALDEAAVEPADEPRG